MQEQQTLLIDLDTLVDTRFGLIDSKFNALSKLGDIDAYTKRIRNDIWTMIGISEDEWRDAWTNRDVSTLQASVYTGLYYHLAAILTGRILNGMMSPVHDTMEITINVWPYRLTTDERDEIAECVREMLWGDVKVETAYLEPERITPQFLSSFHKGYIVYDFEYWMSKQNEAFVNTRVPTVSVYYPAILNHIDEEELAVIRDKMINPFDDLQIRLAEYVSLSAVDAELFSLHRL